MRAIVIATGLMGNGGALNQRLPSVLLPLVDRPFIQHVIEYLVARGIDKVHFLLSYLPEQISAALETGERWGVSVAYHVSRDATAAYRCLRDIDTSDPDEALLLVHGDRLPLLPLEIPASSNGEPVLYYCTTESGIGAPSWTGWASLRARQLQACANARSEAEIERSLLQGSPRQQLTAPLLSVQSYRLLLQSQRMALSGEFAGLLLTGREIAKGVRRAGVEKHSTANLIAPVFVGENCRIDAGAVIGPNAVVGAGVVVDRNSVVTNSLVCAGTYVGEETSLVDTIAHRNCLTNVRLDASIWIAEDFLLGNATGNRLRSRFDRLLSRAGALLLLVLNAPLYLLLGLYLVGARSRAALRPISAVRLPAPIEQANWPTMRLWRVNPPTSAPSPARHFFFDFLPGLVDVALGKLALVGLPPRSPHEIRALHDGWRALYLSGKVGLVTEELARYGDAPGEEERYAAEAFYVVSRSAGYDLRLLSLYIKRLFRSCFGFERTRP